MRGCRQHAGSMAKSRQHVRAGRCTTLHAASRLCMHPHSYACCPEACMPPHRPAWRPTGLRTRRRPSLLGAYSRRVRTPSAKRNPPPGQMNHHPGQLALPLLQHTFPRPKHTPSRGKPHSLRTKTHSQSGHAHPRRCLLQAGILAAAQLRKRNTPEDEVSNGR